MDNRYITREIMITEGPIDPVERKHLEKQLGFKYHMAIGELIYALTICRLDISNSVITLLQHLANLVKKHYDAV